MDADLGFIRERFGMGVPHDQKREWWPAPSRRQCGDSDNLDPAPHMWVDLSRSLLPRPLGGSKKWIPLTVPKDDPIVVLGYYLGVLDAPRGPGYSLLPRQVALRLGDTDRAQSVHRELGTLT